MSKTNHQRAYKAPMPKELRVRYGAHTGHSAKAQLADVSKSGKYFSFGEDRYNRRHKAGAKKFVRSRLRHHDNAATRQLALEAGPGSNL